MPQILQLLMGQIQKVHAAPPIKNLPRRQLRQPKLFYKRNKNPNVQLHVITRRHQTTTKRGFVRQKYLEIHPHQTKVQDVQHKDKEQDQPK